MTAKQLVESKLDALHKDAQKDFFRIGKGMIKSIFRPMQASDFERAYLTISKEQGKALQHIIIDNDCKQIVEFGTSFGISTIYLAEAARETGGKVVSTELIDSKAIIAAKNLADAGLSEYVEILVGDAMDTLKSYSQPIDLLFLDGWKDLYVPLLQLLEPQFHPGTLIYADNMNMSDTKNYAEYITTNKTLYSNQVIHGGKAFLTIAL